jgi:3-phosphoshikimate 1-carboxyvinyltransferase
MSAPSRSRGSHTGQRVGLPDRVRIHPAALSGSVAVTGDKSLSHRCLLVGSLVRGSVELRGLAPSADVAASAEALRQLGCSVELEPAGDGRLEGVVVGSIVDAALDRASGGGPVAIDCGNSGTTLRLLAGLAAGAGHHVVLDGDESLRRRPVDRVTAPLAAMGATTRARDGRLPPLEIVPSPLVGVAGTVRSRAPR